jgi:hypothetical protein
MSLTVERGEELERRVSALSDDMRASRVEMSAGFAEVMRALGRTSLTPQNTPVSPADRPSVYIPMATDIFEREPTRRIFEGQEAPAPRLSSFDVLIESKKLPPPTVVMERPRFAGKKLSSLDIKEVLIFCDSVRNFEAEHSTSLPVGTLFTDEARSALITKADGRLTLAKFFQYPLEILLKELQKAVRPLSKESFRQAIFPA